MDQLLTPVRIGRYIAPNRLVMAPMTRSRADADGVPGDMTVTYHAQRASAGLAAVAAGPRTRRAWVHPIRPINYSGVTS